MSERFTVLFSSAGRRVALMDAFARSLETLGLEPRLLAADMSRLSAAFHHAERAFQVPRCTDEAFVPAMLDLCERERVDLLVPTIDPELPVYAAHREAFAEVGTTVAVSAPPVVAIGGDKHRTHRWLQEAGLPTVRQTSPEGALQEPDRWPLPLFAKPAAGSASVGARVVQDLEELERLHQEGGDYVVQTLARGVEHTIDLYCDRMGRLRCAVPRRRLEVRAGEVSKGVTVRHPALTELAERVVASFPAPAFGALNVQVFFEEESGVLRVIELNPRFGGGYPLSHRAGADFPRWLAQEARGEGCDARDDTWCHGLLMLRYDAAVFVAAEKAGLDVPAGSGRAEEGLW